MEQYFMPKELDFENLRLCLDNYVAERLHIMDCGDCSSYGSDRWQGRVKVDERLEGRVLDFRKGVSGLYMLIDSDEVFHFPLYDYDNAKSKGFSVEYGRAVDSDTCVNPYDPRLPEPERSILRHYFDDHILEIAFSGRVHLKFHSLQAKAIGRFWRVVKPS